MEQNKATLQAALRALRVGKEVVTSVQALTPHIKASGDLETIKNGAEDYYREITGVVGGNWLPDRRGQLYRPSPDGGADTLYS